MDRTELQRQVEGFDPAVPIEEAWTPPSSWYVEPAFLTLEGETVFRSHWLCAARADQVPESGDYTATSTASRQHLVVRDEDQALRAFHNVCRHHGALLMEGAGRCAELACAYHGWTYALDGRLIRAPRSGGMRGFDRDDFRLVDMGVEEWGPLVFVHDDSSADPLRASLGDLLNRLDLDGLHFVARREYLLKCNWKVFVDNYLDGGYHVSTIHNSLAGQLDLASYRTEFSGLYSIQSCLATPGSASTGDLGDRIGDRALYAWIHPNLMLNRYGPILDTNLVVPISADETLVIFDYYFEDKRAGDSAFVERSLSASDRVQQEDVTICESVQRGLSSPAYDRGRYAPKTEGAAHHFHRLLAEDLSAGLG